MRGWTLHVTQQHIIAQPDGTKFSDEDSARADLDPQLHTWAAELTVIHDLPMQCWFVAADMMRFSHLVPRSSEVRTSAAAAITPMRCGQRVTRSRARQRPSRAMARSVGARKAVISWL